eukprot:gene1807-16297_t
MEPESNLAAGKENPDKDKKAARGRSKKRVTSKKGKPQKKRQPFSHIASGILPSAAIASASPNVLKYVGKNRSPSPLARAVFFASKIGHAIAAGPKLDRSLSVQELHTQSTSAGLAESKNLSKSHPGPSSFRDEEVDFADGAHYESVREFKSKTHIKDIVRSPVAGRPPMPIPDEGDFEENTHVPDGLYSKVAKQGTKVEKLQKMRDLQDDSDELTFVSEMDEDTPSKSFVKRAKVKQHPDSQNEDSSSGPSDGEIYRIPFDAINNEAYSGVQFQTIEELENENFTKSRSTDGVVSPASVRSKASSHGSTGFPQLQRVTSLQNVNSEQEQRQSRPQSPREMGREAALRRLEELGFDAISKEFGMSLNSSYNSGVNYENVEDPLSVNVVETSPSALQEELEQASPMRAGSNVNQIPEGKVSVAAMSKMFESNQRIEGTARHIVEEPQIGFSSVVQDESSHEMMLEELVDESHLRDEQVASDLSDQRKEASISCGSSLIARSPNSDEVTQRSVNQESRGISDVKVVPAKEQTSNDLELQRQNDLLRSVLKNQETLKKKVDDMYLQPGTRQSPQGGLSLDTSRNDRQISTGIQVSSNPQQTDAVPDKTDVTLSAQKQMQDVIRENQDKILATIAALEKQFENVTTAIATDKKDKEIQDEKLMLLRTLITDEQNKYTEQQKILNEHERKILATQQMASEKRATRPSSRFSSSPVSPRKYHDEAHLKRDFHQQPVQFKMLEDRLKSVEAERSALLELNSSLHDENDTLKRLAFSQNNAVHRLNIELSRYQAKYRPPRSDEIEGLSLPQEGPIPEWLVNIKYLSPLIMAYDDRIKDKNEVICAYEMASEKSDQSDAVAVDEWNVLQEQAKLVVDENAILMQEIDLKDRRISEILDDHQLETSRFTKRVRILENEKRNLQMKITALQIDNEAWKKRHDEAVSESEKKITEEEAKRRIEQVQRPLEQKMEYMERSKDDSSFRFQALMKEKQELAIKLTDASATVSRQQMEMDLLSKSLRKAEKKLVVMDRKMGTVKEKEMIATETLRQVLSVAEESSKERDVFAKLIKSQNNETIISYKQKIENEKRLEHQRKELEKYKELVKRKSAEVLERVKEKDEEILNLKNNYDQEIHNLRQIIASRQNILDYVQTNKSEFENEIDELWKSITEENKELKKSLNN